MMSLSRFFRKLQRLGFLYSINSFADKIIGRSMFPISSDRRAYLSQKYGKNDFQTTHIDALNFHYMNSGLNLKGKRVLEIGGSNLPYEMLFSDLKAESWTCVDYLDEWDESILKDNFKDAEETRLFQFARLDGTSAPFSNEYKYIKYHGDANSIPGTFDGQFDAVVSFCCFEHVRELDRLLHVIYNTLKPGGVLCTNFSPLWSSPYGHHYWFSGDYNFHTCARDGIPPYVHLLLTEEEVRMRFSSILKTDVLENFCYWIYRNPSINRLFYEDYVRIFHDSPFENVRIIPGDFLHCGRDSSTTTALNERYPKNTRFDIWGMRVVAKHS